MGKSLDAVPLSAIVRIRDMMYSVKDPFRLDQGDVSFDAPDTFKQAVAKAITDGAEIVLGPLFAQSVTAIAPIARGQKVPVIAFSSDRSACRTCFTPTNGRTRTTARAHPSSAARCARASTDAAYFLISFS